MAPVEEPLGNVPIAADEAVNEYWLAWFQNLAEAINGMQSVKFGDSPSIDAFDRVRVSNPETIFDSKQIFDNQPLFWDDQEVSGGSTSSAHSTDEAATTISVGATTAGKRTRQTFMRFNYQPGKSQLVFCTFSEFDTATGITKEVGQFDDDNGLFLRSDEGTVSIVQRTNITGTPVDTAVAQTSFNIDKLDGNGPSGVTIDWSKANIFVTDYEWLGVGRSRHGVVVDGIIYYFHEFLNANSKTGVYMSTPNLPLRYSIENDGNGAADDFVHICTSVISEGGSQATGTIRTASTDGTHVDADTANTVYAVVGIKLKSTHLGAAIDLLNVSLISETNDDFEWLLLLNPTVADTFAYSNETNSAIMSATGATANTISGGTEIGGGFAKDSGEINEALNNAIRLGAAIDGTVDEIVLCVRPLSANADIQGSITWRELS